MNGFCGMAAAVPDITFSAKKIVQIATDKLGLINGMMSLIF